MNITDSCIIYICISIPYLLVYAVRTTIYLHLTVKVLLFVNISAYARTSMIN